MKTIFLKIAFVLTLVNVWSFSNCQIATDTSSKWLLTVNEFEKKAQEPNVKLVDVRTAEEYISGYIKGAINIDFYAKDFAQQIQTLEKSKTILVYCLGGSRSSKALDIFHKNGFQNVYSLKGGIMKWRLEDKPVAGTIEAKHTDGMSQEEFNERVKGDKLVFVDFFAQWCPPCKKMNPIVEQISADMKDKIVVLKINYDENKSLAKYLKIESFPTLLIYKNGKEVWRGEGVREKEEMEIIINRY